MERNPSLKDQENSVRTPAPRRVSCVFAASRIDQDAVKVIKRLTRHGHAAYLVGGCVRDLLLNRTPKDFDIATSARPNEVRNLFRNCRIIGRRFRLAHVLFPQGKVIEVATFRRDPQQVNDWETPEDETISNTVDERGQRAQALREGKGGDLLIRHDNVFGDPHEDALRRDFTINALFYDIERQEIVDYVGGLREIDRRVLRTIGEPDLRFHEDPVRILRAVKFCARLDLGIDPDTFDAMVAHSEELLRSARPRLLEELLRLLRGGASRRSFWLMWETGILSVLLPELSAWIDDSRSTKRTHFWHRLQRLDQTVARGEVPGDPVLFCSLLFDVFEETFGTDRDAASALPDDFAELIERLNVPRRMLDRMRQILSVQRRLRQGKVGSLSRRDFYPDAVALFELTHGKQPPSHPSARHETRRPSTPAAEPDPVPSLDPAESPSNPRS